MTKKNLKPQQVAPVQRELTAIVSYNGNAIAPAELCGEDTLWGGDCDERYPFAGDNAE
ncbi:MAG: anacyclamide/piricyclamide family prenylated cyclic peptide [Microcystis panniformis]